MEKEREPITDLGFSEKQIDIALDKTANNDQVKPARHASQLAGVAGRGGNIFDPKKTLRQAQGKKPQK